MTPNPFFQKGPRLLSKSKNELSGTSVLPGSSSTSAEGSSLTFSLCSPEDPTHSRASPTSSALLSSSPLALTRSVTPPALVSFTRMSLTLRTTQRELASPQICDPGVPQQGCAPCLPAHIQRPSHPDDCPSKTALQGSPDAPSTHPWLSSPWTMAFKLPCLQLPSNPHPSMRELAGYKEEPIPSLASAPHHHPTAKRTSSPHMKVKVFAALCHPMGCSPPGSFVYRILQARILEWVTIPFSRGSS